MLQDTVWTLLRSGISPEGPEHMAIADTHKQLNEKLSKLRVAHEDRHRNHELQRTEELVAAYSSILAPIRKIPQEILERVFVLCLPDNSGPSPANSNTPPLSISHVCFLWRSIAIDLPLLWCGLALIGRHSYQQSHNFARVWLQRAARSNRIQLRYDAIPGEIFDFSGVAPHIQLLELTVPASEECTLSLLSKPFYSSLQDLALTVRSDYFDIETPTAASLQSLKLSPRLRKLKLDFEAYEFEHHRKEIIWLFPWMLLTHLRIDYLYVGLLQPILHHCRRLQHGSFRILNYARVDAHYPYMLNCTELDDLVTLSIISDNDNFNPEIFGRIFFPNLSSFVLEEMDELSYPEEPRRWIQPDHFFAQVQNLQSLTFSHPPHDLPLLLRNTPLLHDLTIKTHHNVDYVLKAMTLEPEILGHDILPRLTIFHLDRFVRIKASAEHIIAMVRSRRMNVPASSSEYILDATLYTPVPGRHTHAHTATLRN